MFGLPELLINAGPLPGSEVPESGPVIQLFVSGMAHVTRKIIFGPSRTVQFGVLGASPGEYPMQRSSAFEGAEERLTKIHKESVIASARRANSLIELNFSTSQLL